MLAIIRRSEAYTQHGALNGSSTMLNTLYWSTSTHHFHDCSPASAQGFGTVLHVAARLMHHESQRQAAAQSTRRTRSAVLLPCHLPLEMWHHILTFLRRTDLEADEAVRTMIEDAPICEIFSTAVVAGVDDHYAWWHSSYREWQGRHEYIGPSYYTYQEPAVSCPLYMAMLQYHDVTQPGYGTDCDIAKMLMACPSASTPHAKLIINQAAVGSADADGREYVQNFDPCGSSGFGEYYGGVLLDETDNSVMTELLIRDLPGDPIVKTKHDSKPTHPGYFSSSKIYKQGGVRKDVYISRELAQEHEGICLSNIMY